MASIAARRYVKAVYELAKEAGTADTALADLGKVARLMKESDEFQQLMLNPSIGHEKKAAVFNAIVDQLGISTTVAGLMRLLIRKSRVELLEDIVDDYEAQENDRRGIISMEIKTASPLSESLKQELKTKFEKATGKQVEMKTIIDEVLIGGMVAKIGGTIYDGSIEHQLNLIQQRLGE